MTDPSNYQQPRPPMMPGMPPYGTMMQQGQQYGNMMNPAMMGGGGYGMPAGQQQYGQQGMMYRPQQQYQQYGYQQQQLQYRPGGWAARGPMPPPPRGPPPPPPPGASMAVGGYQQQQYYTNRPPPLPVAGSIDSKRPDILSMTYDEYLDSFKQVKKLKEQQDGNTPAGTPSESQQQHDVKLMSEEQYVEHCRKYTEQMGMPFDEAMVRNHYKNIAEQSQQ